MDRRRVLCGLAGAGLIAAALAACGDDDSGNGSGKKPAEAQTDPDGTVVLAATADIAVGSGVVVTTPDNRPVVVVQPEEGTFKAFSATCTHQGTTVNPPTDNVIVCPNHKSEFSAEDGSVIKEPATRPLASIEITVKDGNVVLA